MVIPNISDDSLKSPSRTLQKMKSSNQLLNYENVVNSVSARLVDFCKKTCNRYQMRENIQPAPSAGKHVTEAKHGKTCNRRQMREDMSYLLLEQRGWSLSTTTATFQQTDTVKSPINYASYFLNSVHQCLINPITSALMDTCTIHWIG